MDKQLKVTAYADGWIKVERKENFIMWNAEQFDKHCEWCSKELMAQDELIQVKEELDQLRRSQIQPAVKFLSNSIMNQLNHIQSEYGEVSLAFVQFCNINCPGGEKKKENLIEELIDLQFSCQTMLEGPLKLTKEQIADAIQKVVQKNKARDYDKQP